jgi:hypothetical protein
VREKNDVKPDHTWIISPIEKHYPLAENITAASIPAFLNDTRVKEFLL